MTAMFGALENISEKLQKKLVAVFKKELVKADIKPTGKMEKGDVLVRQYGGYIMMDGDKATEKSLEQQTILVADHAIKSIAEVGGELLSVKLICKHGPHYVYLDKNGEVCEPEDSTTIKVIQVITVGWKASIRNGDPNSALTEKFIAPFREV